MNYLPKISFKTPRGHCVNPYQMQGSAYLIIFTAAKAHWGTFCQFHNCVELQDWNATILAGQRVIIELTETDHCWNVLLRLHGCTDHFH